MGTPPPKTGLPMFTAALFIITPKGANPNDPPQVEGWTNHDIAIQWNTMQQEKGANYLYSLQHMNLKIMMLSERTTQTKLVHPEFNLHANPEKRKLPYRVTKRSVVAWEQT